MHVWIKACILFSAFIGVSKNVWAHPMPNSLVLISMQEEQLHMELLLPLTELELAYGKPLQDESEIIQKHSAELSRYILNHFKVYSEQSLLPWPMRITSITADPLAKENSSGYFRELIVTMVVDIPKGVNPRKFTLDYDIIIHQVVTHFAVVKIVQDFKTGTIDEQPLELGLIQLDIRNNIIPPFKVDLKPGSHITGLKRFFFLGIDHILSGTDHLMFLLMLLLVTPLIALRKTWSAFESNKKAIKKIISIVTAFTIGHSLTLLLVAFIAKEQAVQVVEVLIAFSIFVSAIHVLRPIFPGREMLIAIGFGLIHGMAFGNSLNGLYLDTSSHLMAVLSFNVGIEIMQLIIIAAVIPLLLLLKGKNYHFVRITGGVIGCVASISWMAERITGHENGISRILNQIHF